MSTMATIIVIRLRVQLARAQQAIYRRWPLCNSLNQPSHAYECSLVLGHVCASVMIQSKTFTGKGSLHVVVAVIKLVCVDT